MSRHRNVRNIDYNDECDSYDDVYGHSVDDDNYISPSDASQWLYDRAKGQQSISAFMANNENIEEEDESGSLENGDCAYEKKRRDSENFQMPVLDDLTQAKLMSCIDDIRNVVGDSISDRQIVEAVTKYDYDVAKALDSILNASTEKAQERKNARPPKDSNEKDVKANVAISNLKFKIPSLRPNQAISSPLVGESSNKKLDEYIKRSFQSTNVGTNASTPIFIVPQLKPNNGQFAVPKLDQLANSSFKSASPQQPGSGFIVPKLGSSLPNQSPQSQIQSPSNHDLLLKKIMESKKSKAIEVQELSSSFGKKLTLDQEENRFGNNGSSNNEKHSSQMETSIDAMAGDLERKSTNEQHDADMSEKLPISDCDKLQEDEKPEAELSCRLDISAILKENTSKIIAKPTNFGKVMVLKYRCRFIPYVQHAFKAKHNVARFKFESKSPDDIILGHLKKSKI